MPSTWQTDDSIVPKNNPEVAQIMHEQGIGRRRAYALARRRAAEAIDTESVTYSQKELVLKTLFRHPEVRTSEGLLEVLDEEGNHIDLHDIVKMLWACQKSGWVKFRERGNRKGMYHIRVSEKGVEALANKQRKEERAALEAIASAELSAEEVVATTKPEPITEETIQEAVDDLVEEGILEEVVGGDEPAYVGPIVGLPILDIKNYPAIEALGYRAVKAEKLNAAARLLEEAGEEDIALTVMSKTEFTELEQDVIRLIKDAVPQKEA